MHFNCPNCGTEFIKGTKFCQTCGCNLELEFIESPICPQCKKTFAEGTKFCVIDGTKLVRHEDLIPRCTICNRQYSEEIKFCPQDGGEVKVIVTPYIRPTYRPQQNYSALSNRNYIKASLGNRFVAALLDGLITAGLSIPAILFFVAGIEKSKSYNDDGAVGFIFIAVLFYLLPLIYNLIKDGLGQGQSWGKKSLNLMVVNLDNNSPCDKGKSFVRNIISALVAIIPFIGWLIEPIMVIATEDGRKLGDKAANTQVIEIKNFN